MAPPSRRGVAARANLLERPAERGGATLVGLALAGFVLMAGVVAVDVGALAGARATAQTAADMAALAALSPEVEPPPQSAPAHQQPPEQGSATTQVDDLGTPQATARTDGRKGFRPAAKVEGRKAAQAGAAVDERDWRASRAAEIAMANGAELVTCDCSAVQAVVGVRRRVRFVPGGHTVLVTARARAVLGWPPL